MEITPQPESCMLGLWNDAIAEAKETADFLNTIDNIEQYLLDYPFLADTGEVGVRRIAGCYPLQRSVYLRDAVTTKIGVNCFERTRVFIAKNILINGLENTQRSYKVMDILLTPEIRHVFPLASDGKWVILNRGEATLAQTITGGTGHLTMNPPQANGTPVEPEDDFANDPVIGGIRKLANHVESKVSEMNTVPHANDIGDGTAAIHEDDIKQVMLEKFGAAHAYYVVDGTGRPKYIIPMVSLRRANDGGPDEISQGLSSAVATALDPLINRGAATFAQNLKDENGYIPIKTEFTIDPLVLVSGLAAIAMVVFGLKRSK